MLPFLSSILSVALPVAKIAAQVLPQVLGNLQAQKALGASPSDPAISNTLLEFVGDELQHKLYAVNRTPQTLAVSFQNNVETGGSIGVQSESFPVPPRNAADITKDAESNADSGTISANYYEGNASVGGTNVNPLIRRAILSLPFVSAMAFTAFGGKVEFKRETVTEPNRTFDRWAISSSSKLLSVLFSYKTQNGQSIDFKADLKNDKASTTDAGPFVYTLDTDGVGLTTGMLTNFNVTVEGEEASLSALLSKRELTEIGKLPEHVRARLSVS